MIVSKSPKTDNDNKLKTSKRSLKSPTPHLAECFSRELFTTHNNAAEEAVSLWTQPLAARINISSALTNL